MIHELKTEQPFFDDAVEGRKPFEVRRDDRPFNTCDFLALNEIVVPKPGTEIKTPSEMILCDDEGRYYAYYTGRCALFYVSHVLRDRRFVPDGFCILGIRPARMGYNRDNMAQCCDDRLYGAVVYSPRGGRA